MLINYSSGVVWQRLFQNTCQYLPDALSSIELYLQLRKLVRDGKLWHFAGMCGMQEAAEEGDSHSSFI